MIFKILSTFFDLFLFASSPMLRFLDQKSQLTWLNLSTEQKDHLQFGLFISALVIFAGKRFINEISWPRKVSSLEIIKGDIDHLMKVLIAEYCNILYNITNNQAIPTVRLNLMLPTSPHWGPKFLKIYFFSANAPNANYSDLELNTQWHKGSGSCGTAWANQRIVISDPEDPRYSAPNKALNSEQKKLRSASQSILSLPVWNTDRTRVLAILNFDSAQGIHRTQFDNVIIIQLMSPFLSHLSHILDKYKTGVRKLQ